MRERIRTNAAAIGLSVLMVVALVVAGRVGLERLGDARLPAAGGGSDQDQVVVVDTAAPGEAPPAPDAGAGPTPGAAPGTGGGTPAAGATGDPASAGGPSTAPGGPGTPPGIPRPGGTADAAGVVDGTLGALGRLVGETADGLLDTTGSLLATVTGLVSPEDAAGDGVEAAGLPDDGVEGAGAPGSRVRAAGPPHDRGRTTGPDGRGEGPGDGATSRRRARIPALPEQAGPATPPGHAAPQATKPGEHSSAEHRASPPGRRGHGRGHRR